MSVQSNQERIPSTVRPSSSIRSENLIANPNYQFMGAPPTPGTPYNRNQFGGSGGLPIIKNKLFIFGDYSGWREVTPINAYYMTVPTAKMRSGDFSELFNPSFTNGAYATVYPLCNPRAGTTSAGRSLTRLHVNRSLTTRFREFQGKSGGFQIPECIPASQ